MKPHGYGSAASAVNVAARSHRRAQRVARHLVRHDPHVRRLHARTRVGLLAFIRGSDWPTLLTAPAVYSVALPLVILDLCVTFYQAICFRVWGIARVRRRRHFVIDRARLAYLNLIEKANCLYCSYALGVIGYVAEVAARTEQYWCPIKHARTLLHPHARYEQFVEYGDAEGYRRRLRALRGQLGARSSR